MTVYVDVLFFINFMMDYLIISLTGVMATVKFRRGKMLLSALLGALLGVIHFVFVRHAAISLLFGIGIPLLINLCALYPCEKKLFSRCLLCFSASAFLVSGAVTFTLNILGIEDSSITSPFIYLTAGLVFLLAKNIHSMLKSSALKGEYEITVSYDQYSVARRAKLDTGNSLTDPLTKRPVIVADESILSELFGSGCNSINITEWIDPLDLRIIPYKTIDKTGIMTGFIPTAVTINGRAVPNAIIAISPKNITSGVLLNSSVV